MRAGPLGVWRARERVHGVSRLLARVLRVPRIQQSVYGFGLRLCAEPGIGTGHLPDSRARLRAHPRTLFRRARAHALAGPAFSLTSSARTGLWSATSRRTRVE